MAFCVKCGAEIPEGEKLCSACGKALLEREEALRKEREEREKKEKALYEASVEGEANHIFVLGIISVILGLLMINNIIVGLFKSNILSLLNTSFVLSVIYDYLFGWVTLTEIGAIILGIVVSKRFEDIYSDTYDEGICIKMKTGKKLAKAGIIIGVIMLILWVIYFIASGAFAAGMKLMN